MEATAAHQRARVTVACCGQVDVPSHDEVLRQFPEEGRNTLYPMGHHIRRWPELYRELEVLPRLQIHK